jgi:putative membrane protein
MRAYPLFIALTVVAVAWSDNGESFYQTLAEGDIAEIDAANLALEKSSNAKVREFAAMMVKDHTATNERLKAILASKGSKLPSSASATQRAIQTRLAILSGRVFDQFYIRDQIFAHEGMLDLVNSEISSGKDAKAVAFARDILPTVQMHLKMIRALAAGEGV